MLNKKINYRVTQGFSLIEMMIALTVGLIILGAVSMVMVNSAKSSRANDRTSELQTNGRYALDVLRRDITHAGQTGMMPPHNIVEAKQKGFFLLDGAVTVTNDCAVSALGTALQLEQPVGGLDDATPAGVCAAINNYATGDVLAVRYADMQAFPITAANANTTPAAINPNDIYVRSSYAKAGIYQQGKNLPVAMAEPIQDQLMKSYVYYVAPNTTPGDGIPALYRLTLAAGGVVAQELVAAGIEDMQVQYGVVTGALPNKQTRYFDAGGVVDWTAVRSVRIWLLVRNSSAERNETYSNTTSYQMGNKIVTPVVGTNDKFRRQVYSATIQLRNEG